MSLTKASYSMVTGAKVNVFDYMTPAQIEDVQAGTLLVDVSAPIQAAVTDNLTGGVIVFPDGKYLITTPIIKPMNFRGPSFEGRGWISTEFHYPNLNPLDACLEIIGGSGDLTSIYISGIGFYGRLDATGTRGIIVDGQDGVIISKCKFGDNKFGINFYNRSGGAFTEFCVAEDCQFTVYCGVKIYYSREAGATNSFNGTGFRNCQMNTDNNIQNDPFVVVEDNCLVYAAPMDGQFWISGSNPSSILLRNNNTGVLNCYWHGNITIESFGPTLVLAETGLSTRNFFVGAIESLNENYSYGALTTCHDYYGRSLGSTTMSKKPWKVTGTATTGTTTVNLNLPVADATLGSSTSFLLHVALIGAGYIYTHVLLFVPGITVGAAAYVTTLFNAQQFNSAGWGMSTFGIGGVSGDSRLTITNASVGFNVQYNVGLTQIGWGQP
jgi:hypothetical protein